MPAPDVAPVGATPQDVDCALEMRGLGKTYVTDRGDRVEALRDIDLRVRTGEWVVLLGPTGCGKTTLLNLIAGLDKPDGGELRRAPELRPGLNIPCVFQHYTLFPWRTALDNVAFGLQMQGLGRVERRKRARAELERVGLGGFESVYPHELSGGMRQRAAIAQAMAVEPRLLLMDEPFGALDDSTRRELQAGVAEWWQEHDLTVLFVTHSIDEAVALADRVVVMSARPGRVVAERPVDLPRPRDPLSEAFTGLHVELRRLLAGGG